MPWSTTAIRGSQYLSISHTERLAEVGIEQSVGSVGDSYDNALAESIIGLYKAEGLDPAARGKAWRRWSSQRSTGWVGSITAESSSRSGTGLRPRPKRRTIAKESTRRWPRDSNKTVSGKTRAVQTA